MKEYAQISFDFTALKPEDGSTDPSIGVRVKSLKKPADAAISETEKPVQEREIAVEENEIKSGRGRKSQKTFAAEADLICIPDDEQLFSKHYYTIGEVSAMFRVNPSLLRFWESEFPIIKPKKNKKGDRYFRPSDIKNLQLIYDLLRRRKLTIEGARDFMKKNKKTHERFEMIRSLQEIKRFLQQLRAEINSV